MNNNKESNMQNTQDLQEKKPDDQAGFHIEGHIKIHDPETKEVFVEKRA